MTDLTDLVDLAAERVGGAALIANDEFFAGKENLLKPGRGEWREGVYTDRGKWMDGWESRRRRQPGHDWCVIKLGVPGVIRGVDVDTNHFKGNFPEACSIDACAVDGDPSAEELVAHGREWVEILPRRDLQGHSQNIFEVKDERRWTHIRLSIYPDGGVARLRVYGEAIPDWRRIARGGAWADLAAVENGGAVVACNDMFFGSRHNLIMPGRAVNMGDGWETKRKRKLPWGTAIGGWGPDAPDWVIVRLGVEGTLARIEVDTNHFKGNFPESCAIEGCRAPEGTPLEALVGADRDWTVILPRTKLRAHTRHFLEEQDLTPGGPYTHVRLRIYPDGGVSRLRLWGAPSADGYARAALRHLNTLTAEAAEAELLKACGSRTWARAMAKARPFSDPEALGDVADHVWASLAPEDRYEAFRAHPRIGSRGDVAKKAGVERSWSEKEQAGASAAASDTLAALEEGNRAYEERFGHIFIICATGKSADEMLAALRERLRNDPKRELGIASEEQGKIMRLRLEKMLRAAP